MGEFCSRAEELSAEASQAGEGLGWRSVDGRQIVKVGGIKENHFASDYAAAPCPLGPALGDRSAVPEGTRESVPIVLTYESDV